MLNAFRHHGERDSALLIGAHVEIREVLNAFRHHGERDAAEQLPTTSPLECSTPSGITASGTPLDAYGDAEQYSAQRLPASRRAGLANDPKLPLLRACSTPSGITASGTIARNRLMTGEDVCSTPSGITASGTAPARDGLPRGLPVLNAFRHHGERDWNQKLPMAQAPTGAQRLPASRRAGRYKAIPYITYSVSAQRLPASRRAGRQPDVGVLRQLQVLNAFRHHGERDFPSSGIAMATRTCSTPSGITASGTEAPRLEREEPLAVLNAFRHHGERDLGF